MTNTVRESDMYKESVFHLSVDSSLAALADMNTILTSSGALSLLETVSVGELTNPYTSLDSAISGCEALVDEIDQMILAIQDTSADSLKSK